MKLSKKIYYIFFTLIFGGFSLSFFLYQAIRKSCSRSGHPKYETVILEKRALLAQKFNLKEIQLKTKDNIKLAAFLILREKAKRVLLVCHGHWQAKEFMDKIIELFDQFNIFVFDFRSHGASGGDLITMGLNEKQDIEAAVAFLKSYNVTKDLPIIGLGFSMGGAALAYTASQNHVFDKIILDSVYSKLDASLCRQFTKITGLPCSLFALGRCIFELLINSKIEKINPINFVGNIKCPVFVIHSQDDTVVPVKDAYELYDAIKSPKELWIVAGPNHVKIHKKFPQEYKNRVLNFVEKT